MFIRIPLELDFKHRMTLVFHLILSFVFYAEIVKGVFVGSIVKGFRNFGQIHLYKDDIFFLLIFI